jgi:hypothetical protein
MEDINKTSRATDERSKNERPKHWTPPSSLDAPKPKDGFVHRWLRYEIAGFQDTANMSKRLREGYELVKSEEVESGSHNYPVYDKSHRLCWVHWGWWPCSGKDTIRDCKITR